MNTNHETFCDNLRRSEPGVQSVAGFLESKGFDVTVLGQHVPPTYAEGIPDECDIIAVNKKGQKFKIEVKEQPNKEWGKLEWCVYGLIIETVSAWAEKDPKPDAYYILDKHHKVARVFLVSNWDKTYIHKIRDNNTGRLRECYLAHPDEFKVVRIAK